MFMGVQAAAGEMQPQAVSIDDVTVHIPIADASDLSFSRVGLAQGLSQTRVAQIVQDTRGFMWFGTQYGLDRYDGYRFKVFVHDRSAPTSLSDVFVSALFVDRSGQLWVGCDSFLDRYDPRTESFAHYPIGAELPGHPAVAVTHIDEDRAGMLWLSTAYGLFRFDPQSGRTAHFAHLPTDPSTLSSSNIKSAGEDRSGVFWVATEEGIDRFDRMTSRVTLHIPLHELREMSFYEDRQGTFWIIHASGGGLATFDRKSLRLTHYSFAKADLGEERLTGVSAMLEDRDGVLWIGTLSDGVLKFDRERHSLIRYRNDPTDSGSLAENRVTTLLQDRDGGIWVGLGATPPNYLPTPQPEFRRFLFDLADRSNLGEHLVNAIYQARNGTVWFGVTGGLARWKGIGNHVGSVSIPGLPANSDVLAFIEDQPGNLWIGTSGQGLYRLDRATGQVRAYRHENNNSASLSNDTVIRLFIDHASSLWVATADGLNRFDSASERFVTYRPGRQPGAATYLSITEDHAGSLWIGGWPSGLTRLNPATGAFQLFSLTDGLSGTNVNNVFTDHSGFVWVGTHTGLSRVDPKNGSITSYFVKDGLPSGAISCILEDDAGGLWLGTNNGLSRFDPGDRTFRNYSAVDGLPGPDFTGWNACYRGTAGEMFFGGFSGAVAFNPRELKDNAYVPPVALTSFELFGVPVSLGAGSPLSRAIDLTSDLQLPSWQNTFSFEFAALSYRNPATNRYRYMLDGLDRDWLEVRADRRVASYTTVPAGVYTFRMQGATNRGQWSVPGTVVHITVLPPWWNRWQFKVAAAACLLLGIWLVYLVRIRTITRQFNIRLDERVGERARIARELHDSLLQGFQGLVAHLLAIRNMLPDRPSEAVSALEHAMDRTDEALAEGRKAVQDLRSSEHMGKQLEDALQNLGALSISRDAEDGAPSFRMVVEGKSRPVDPIVRDEVHGIAREALRNAVQHANARHLEIELAFDAQELRLRIRDDGVGIDPQVLEEGRRAGHWGLAGMRERAQCITGILKVWSENGVGTEVELTIPGEVAYGRGGGLGKLAPRNHIRS
jgi:ligand-binding sensor domain-containing protein